MQIPFWKKLLSYLIDIHIETTSSAYNEVLHVSIVQGRYQLTTPDAIYSWADKYANYKLVFEKLKWSQVEVSDVLVLGLGLGSIPYMLEQMGFDFHYTGVEIDEEVIYLASKYSLSSLQSSVDVIHADASIYLSTNTSRYDLIAMDIFVGQTVPEIFLTTDFALRLADNLTEKGVVIYNMLAHNLVDLENALTYYQEVFLPVFDRATYLHIKGNLMLISDNRVLTEM